MATIATKQSEENIFSMIWSWITTVDHKRIGVLYFVTAFIMFLVAGIEAGIMRMQLAQPGGELVSPDVYNQMFTMHGTTMVFFAIMPLNAAFFNYIIPLAIGARDVAFPRLNAFSYWTFLASVLFMNFGFVVGSVPDGGWFAYAPLSEQPYSSNQGMEFWSIGLMLAAVSSAVAGLNFVVTIVNLRAPGMTLMRMPVSVWMFFVVQILLAFAIPVIAVGLIELTMDRLFGTLFFVTSAGGDPILWQHLFWIFGHPEVYILILPPMGIISDVLPAFAKKPLFGYPFIVFSGIAIGLMGWAVWSHHMFTVGLGPIAVSVFTITTMLIAVPTGVKIFNWIGTLWGGSIEYKSAMLFAVGFIAMFIIGGLSGVSHAVAPSDYQQQDTYYIIAHLHYVLFGGAILGIFSGIYFWFPKVTGKLLSEKLGKLHFWITFVGLNLTFFPMHYLGMNGMPRRIYTYATEFGWDNLNALSSFGYIVLFVSMLIFVYNIIKSYKSGEEAGHDPWDAPGLEWTITSPPPVYNFSELPVVEGRDPYWIVKRRAVAEGKEIPGPQPLVDPSTVHLPDPSYWPIFTSVALLILAIGFMIEIPVWFVKYPISVVGGLLVFVGVLAWSNEPPTKEKDH